MPLPIYSTSDAAIVKLSNPIKITGDSMARSVCLPSKDDVERFDQDTELKVTGWGATNDLGDIHADKLKELSVPWINNTECQAKSKEMNLT